MLGLNPWAILGAAGVWLASLVLCGWLMYARGHDDMRNAYTEQALAATQSQLHNAQTNAKKADDAGQQHEKEVQVVHNTTREIVRTVTIPADSDPYLPVGFVRLFDRSASRDASADPYPGKSDGEPSDVRVSEAASLLTKGWADQYYTCKKQVDDVRALSPVLPSPPQESKGLLEKLNPF